MDSVTNRDRLPRQVPGDASKKRRPINHHDRGFETAVLRYA
jgi:hypothetical protein